MSKSLQWLMFGLVWLDLSHPWVGWICIVTSILTLIADRGKETA